MNVKKTNLILFSALLYSQISFAQIAQKSNSVVTTTAPLNTAATNLNQKYSFSSVQKIKFKSENLINYATVKELVLPERPSLVHVNYTPKKSPALMNIPEEIPLLPYEKFQTLFKPEGLTQIPPSDLKLEFVGEPLKLSLNDELIKSVNDLSQYELKMLQALILFEYAKNYELAMNLFVDLFQVKEYKDQAQFHYAESAFTLNLFSEFREQLLNLVQNIKDKDLKVKALNLLVQKIDFLEVSDIENLHPLVKKYDIDILNSPSYLLKAAKYFSRQNNFKEFDQAVLYIPTEAPQFMEASLIKSIMSYKKGELDEAISHLEFIWPQIKDRKREDFRNLTALTLARYYFQKSDYKKSFEYYTTVDKTSPFWLTSMVEQAWTQVLAQDNEGAAGNMFSLHTDFFKKAYAPETYIVRTVGYLNLCQYGDSLHVLEALNKKYKSIYKNLTQFKEQNTSPMAYYELVKTFLTQPKQEFFDGIHKSFLMELARHPDYLVLQKQINNYEDENQRFNKLTVELIKKERESKIAVLKAKNELDSAIKDNENPSKISKLDKIFLKKGIENLMYTRARENMKKMRETAVKRLLFEEDVLRKLAAQNLKNRFITLHSQLDKMITEQEALSYEIYSGAGEHLRYQMAGGEIKERDPSSLNDENKDHYKWKFKGEVWDDEVGHYKSSLKNVCPDQ